MQEILDQKEFPKTKMLSTICSAKQHTHTMHKKRYDLTRYLADRLPELDWFGHGIREIENKTVAMDDYKYHLCVENHLEPHHWTEKLSDAFVAMTLPFYAGDPLATECFPQESFIPIPLDNPQKALEIIRKAMEDGEYEKRLPAIREARRLVLEKYNMFAQTAAVIHNHRETGTIRPGAMLKGRHVLRKNPLNALRELADTLAYKVRSFGRRGTGPGVEPGFRARANRREQIPPAGKKNGRPIFRQLPCGRRNGPARSETDSNRTGNRPLKRKKLNPLCGKRASWPVPPPAASSGLPSSWPSLRNPAFHPC